MPSTKPCYSLDLTPFVPLQTIEIVEEEVERLLDEDSKADQSTYGAHRQAQSHIFDRIN